mmetsp:Transcript_108261/g.170692  ORF Transcript_108261/g.170692 Transcript_108261/m.170692 type:complete len:660 (-) Transcript_108261:104-2083(-)
MMCEDAPVPPGQEGLQYLCSKYSSLITRLREEVLARQQAEGEARLYERRLREEASLREVERRQSEEERRRLQDEILALQALRRSSEEQRQSEAVELRRSAATSKQLSMRCDQLHEACADEAQRALQVLDNAAAGSEALARQGEELTKLRREHADGVLQNKGISEELSTCREHLLRWRRTAGELESKLELVTHARDEAESRSRHLQEELRQALRVASAAKAREAATASCAGRGQRELRSREARLSAVRKEGQRNAQRASTAERRLRAAEHYEAAAERLGLENHELRLRLEAEMRARETAHVEMARIEAGEARAAAGQSEFQSELRTKETLVASSRQRIAELEGELSHARARLELLDGERLSTNSTIEGLRSELKTSREEREETLREKDKAAMELKEVRRRVDRGTPQLAEYKRKLQCAEEALSKANSEVAEEKRSRERCHSEAIRSGEKLRMARSQCNQLRERVRAFEEAELRYPSRQLSVEADFCCKRLEPAPAVAAWGAAPFEAMALPLTPSPPLSPSPPHYSRSSSCARRPGGEGTEGDVDAVREFVAQEEQRLQSWPRRGLMDRGALGESMFEEPRPAIAAQTEAPRSLNDVAQATSSPCANVRHRQADSGLAALLAAEPRVLKLPEPVRLAQASSEPQLRGRPSVAATIAAGGGG